VCVTQISHIMKELRYEFILKGSEGSGDVHAEAIAEDMDLVLSDNEISKIKRRNSLTLQFVESGQNTLVIFWPNDDQFNQLDILRFQQMTEVLLGSGRLGFAFSVPDDFVTYSSKIHDPEYRKELVLRRSAMIAAKSEYIQDFQSYEQVYAYKFLGNAEVFSPPNELGVRSPYEYPLEYRDEESGKWSVVWYVDEQLKQMVLDVSERHHLAVEGVRLEVLRIFETFLLPT